MICRYERAMNRIIYCTKAGVCKYNGRQFIDLRNTTYPTCARGDADPPYPVHDIARDMTGFSDPKDKEKESLPVGPRIVYALEPIAAEEPALPGLVGSHSVMLTAARLLAMGFEVFIPAGPSTVDLVALHETLILRIAVRKGLTRKDGSLYWRSIPPPHFDLYAVVYEGHVHWFDRDKERKVFPL